MNEQVVIFVDGGSRGNPGLSGIGIYVPKDPRTGKFVSASGFVGKGTNNEAEYKALIYALDMAKKAGWNNILVKADSLLVVNQVNGSYKIKNLGLMKLYERVCYYLAHFEKDGHFELVHIPREENKEADKLVNMAIDKAILEGANEEPAFV